MSGISARILSVTTRFKLRSVKFLSSPERPVSQPARLFSFKVHDTIGCSVDRVVILYNNNEAFAGNLSYISHHTTSVANLTVLIKNLYQTALLVFLVIILSSAKSCPGTACYFHANVRATSHTFERSCGHSKVCFIVAQTSV